MWLRVFYHEGSLSATLSNAKENNELSIFINKIVKTKTMKNGKNILLKASLYTGFALVLLGAFAKISHWKGADAIGITGLIITLIYTLIQYSVNSSNVKIHPSGALRIININVSFAIGFSLTSYVAYLKTYHQHIPVLLLLLGIIATLVFIWMALSEVYSSQRITKSEKIMWTICLILLFNLAGFVYLLAGRKRILPFDISTE